MVDKDSDNNENTPKNWKQLSESKSNIFLYKIIIGLGLIGFFIGSIAFGMYSYAWGNPDAYLSNWYVDWANILCPISIIIIIFAIILFIFASKKVKEVYHEN